MRRDTRLLILAAVLCLTTPIAATADAAEPAQPAAPEAPETPETGADEVGPTAASVAAGEFDPGFDPRLRPPDPAWEDPTVLARVGDQVITAGDFYYALDHGKGIDWSVPPDSIKASTLEKIVNEKLLVEEAYRRGYDRAGPLVNYAGQVEDQVASLELRRRIYAGRLDVSDEELRELYERYFYTVRVWHLSVDRENLAQELRARIQAGEDFGTLARRYSEDQTSAKNGGYLGERRAGQLVIHYEDVVFALEPGELSDVIKGKGEHYKIFKLESKERDRTPPASLEAMRPDLAKRIHTRKAGDALFAWQTSVLAKYETTINEENFAVFAHRLRDKIASWEAINAVRHDSLPSSWIFLDWPAEETALEIVNFKGGALTVAEFNKAARESRTCPTCLWRDSDVQLRQFVLGSCFDKLFILEKKAIRFEHLPALDLEVERRKENRMAAMVAATITVTADSVSTADARAYWEEHKQNYPSGEQARVRRILLDTEEEAKEIVDRLKGGADFGALAERYSKDETTNWRRGETDFFTAGSMYGMADVALQYEPGVLIPPFKSQKGWEVVEVIEKLPSTPMPFAEVEQAIRTHIASDRTERRVSDFIAELRKVAPVTIDKKAVSTLRLPT